MADIRINALATTAASTASDDFVAVDGSANGTRKLNAYSPTFGGNLTLSGATSTITLGSTNTGSIAVDANGALIVTPKAGQYTTLSVSGNSGLFVNNGTTQIYLGNFGGNAVAGTLNANDFLLIRDGAVKLTATATGVDIYGNLTVSGTGTSSVAGKFGVGSTSPNFTGYGIDTAVQTIGGSGSLINGVLELYGTRTTDAQLGHVTFGNSGTRVADIVASRSGANDSARLEFWTANAGTLSLNALLAANGNFLIGTTTDSANGKLQLATHTTSAGGIGFGTDVSLYREASSILTFATATHNYLKITSSVADRQQVIQFVQSGNSASFGFEGGTRGNYVGTTINGYEVLKVYGSTGTALTLDSSQNATFAKKIGIGGTAPTNGFLEITGDGATGTRALYIQGGTAFPTANSILRVDAAGGTAFQVFGSGNVNVLGALAIGNTVQTAVGVASTHKVTISIGGSTYYLLATNV